MTKYIFYAPINMQFEAIIYTYKIYYAKINNTTHPIIIFYYYHIHFRRIDDLKSFKNERNACPTLSNYINNINSFLNLRFVHNMH